MEFQTKTSSSFDVNFNVAGPLVPVQQSTPPLEDVVVDVDIDVEVEMNRLAADSLEPYHYQVVEALVEFDTTYPSIAEVVKECEAFERKRFFAIEGLKGQVKIAAASLMAAAVVITGIGFVSRTLDPASYEAEVEECLLRSDPTEGFECIYK